MSALETPIRTVLATTPGASPGFTGDQVVAAYTAVLGRLPENDEVIQRHLKAGTIEDMLRNIVQSPEFLARSVGGARSVGSPYFHFASMFDAEATIRRHAQQGLAPNEGYLTNFLGVKIDTKVLPHALSGLEGTIEPVPIPANWHADMAEWAAALRAVELARDDFVVVELGCGWGCWLNNTGVAARRLGLDVQLIGVEGDPNHVEFARESTATNGFSPDQVVVHRGIAAPSAGFALFPRQDKGGEKYGLQPVFGANGAERRAAVESGDFDEVVMLPLFEIVGERQRIDLLHIDIQGGEADFIRSMLPLLQDKVAYVLIGTHSREIEGRLCADLLTAGWRLELERPAIVQLDVAGPIVTVDGVQAWRNMTLIPEGDAH